MITYQVVEEEGEMEGIGSYRTFGIAVVNEYGKEMFRVSDVSTNVEFAEKLATDCTNGELIPEQLYDVIRDRLD